MKVRLIGLKTCKYCQKLLSNYSRLNIDFEYWDADDPDKQDELDKMKVFDVPVIQVVDDGKVVWATDPVVYPKGVSYSLVKKNIDKLDKKNE